MELRAHAMPCAMAISATLLFTLPATAQTYENGCTGTANLLAYKQDWIKGVAPNAMPNTPYMGQNSLHYQNTVWNGSNPVDSKYPELVATESVTVSTGSGPNGANVLDFNATAYGGDYSTSGAVFGGFGPIPDADSGVRWWDATEGCVSVKYKWTTAAWNQLAYSPLLVLSKSLNWLDGGLSLGAYVSGSQGTFDLHYPVYDANSASVDWVSVDTYPFTRAATENQWQQFAMVWRNGSTDDAVSTVASDGWLHVYWNGTLIYDLNNIPLIMNADSASAPEGKPNRLRTLWLGYYGLFGPATNVVLTNEPQSWSSTRQVPYFGYYFVEDVQNGNFDYISEVNGYSNVAWISPDHNRVYDPDFGAEFDTAGLKVIVDLGISQERLNNPTGSDFQSYLDSIHAKLSAANLLDNLIAIQPAEEWNDRVTGGMTEPDWEMFSPYTAQTIGDNCGPGTTGADCWQKARRDFVARKLEDVIAEIKKKFPDTPTVIVDTKWSDEYNLNNKGAEDYHPAPRNLDILGIDAYIGYKHLDFTTDCEGAMQQKFIADVRWKYEHALTSYWQPILVVGQAFNDGDWPMPGVCQLNWWYSVAQSHSRFLGLTWFQYGLSPGGVRYYPDQKSWLQNMYLHNQSIPAGAPDLLSPGQALLPNESRTSMDGQFRLIYQGDGNLVLYQLPSWTPLWWSCTENTSPGQAVMQGDGNFVIYDSSNTPIAWTATEGNPGAYLTVQPDGNVVVYTPTAPNASIWYSAGAGCL